MHIPKNTQASIPQTLQRADLPEFSDSPHTKRSYLWTDTTGNTLKCKDIFPLVDMKEVQILIYPTFSVMNAGLGTEGESCLESSQHVFLVTIPLVSDALASGHSQPATSAGLQQSWDQ